MIRKKNIFTDPGDQRAEELIEKIGGNEEVIIERIVSQGHRSPGSGWYDQERDEWVILLSGSAIILFDEGRQTLTLGPGDHLIIPAHCRHRVEWTAPDQHTVWLAVHYRA